MTGIVSTVIPVFNRPLQIVEAVESVVAQSYKSMEIIIVDDGSTDETFSVVQNLKARFPTLIKLLQIENSGPGPAR
ncbi:MAG: glycosyltransferase family 2 protein, partial [bacterium]